MPGPGHLDQLGTLRPGRGRRGPALPALERHGFLRRRPAAGGGRRAVSRGPRPAGHRRRGRVPRAGQLHRRAHRRRDGQGHGLEPGLRAVRRLDPGSHGRRHAGREPDLRLGRAGAGRPARGGLRRRLPPPRRLGGGGPPARSRRLRRLVAGPDGRHAPGRGAGLRRQRRAAVARRGRRPATGTARDRGAAAAALGFHAPRHGAGPGLGGQSRPGRLRADASLRPDPRLPAGLRRRGPARTRPHAATSPAGPGEGEGS